MEGVNLFNPGHALFLTNSCPHLTSLSANPMRKFIDVMAKIKLAIDALSMACAGLFWAVVASLVV